MLAALWAGACAHPRSVDRDPDAIVEGPGRPACTPDGGSGEADDGGATCRGEHTDEPVEGAGSQTVGR